MSDKKVKAEKNGRKDYHLGIRLTGEYKVKLEKRQICDREDSLSTTARKILCKELDKA